MRRAEPLEPEMAAALAAIDATLAGEPVDPEHAELAELALILRAERPAPAAAVTGEIDERVAGLSQRAATRRRRWRPARRWLAAPAAAIAAIALAVVVTGGGGRGPRPLVNDLASTARSSSAAASSEGSSASAATSASATTPAPSPAPSTNRQVVQAAQLSLSAAPSRIDDVAQEVFDVIDSEKGIVSDSHVTSTGGPDGSARFELSVPAANLQRTVSELSQLHGAHVLSRTDDTTDITGQVGGAGRRLAETRALRRSLLRQLASATTTEAIASLRAQLRDADAAIARASANLNGLHRQVDYSRLTVTIQASSVPVAQPSHGGGFTLHRALHDAGRVLVVVAGGALIALAVLVPLALLAGLVAWAALVLRRRRREATLDLV
jgi:Domain of unknown function (DUF4349)